MKQRLICTGCGETDELLKYAKGKNTQYYMCRRCNTRRVKKYRNSGDTELKKIKQRARAAVTNNIRSGKIVKPSKCLSCPSTKRLEAHHPDYSKPLEVLWLCRGCHCRLHML